MCRGLGKQRHISYQFHHHQFACRQKSTVVGQDIVHTPRQSHIESPIRGQGAADTRYCTDRIRGLLDGQSVEHASPEDEWIDGPPPSRSSTLQRVPRPFSKHPLPHAAGQLAKQQLSVAAADEGIQVCPRELNRQMGRSPTIRGSARADLQRPKTEACFGDETVNRFEYLRPRVCSNVTVELFTYKCI